jgi:hypothetical protein
MEKKLTWVCILNPPGSGQCTQSWLVSIYGFPPLNQPRHGPLNQPQHGPLALTRPLLTLTRRPWRKRRQQSIAHCLRNGRKQFKTQKQTQHNNTYSHLTSSLESLRRAAGARNRARASLLKALSKAWSVVRLQHSANEITKVYTERSDRQGHVSLT